MHDDVHAPRRSGRPGTAWLLAASLALAACSTLPREPLAEADAAMREAIEAGQLPGGVLWIESAARGARYHRAYGQRALRPAPEPLDEATVFDAASLTKAVVTAPLVQLLREEGRLELDAPLQRYLPECRGAGYEAISLRLLLTHASGLPAGLSRNPPWSGPEAALRLACAQTLTAAPGSQFRYSDINFILLGAVLERVSGLPLQRLARERLFEPLGMRDSGYLPLQHLPAARIAPTQEIAQGQVLRGEVHDPTARAMGGVAGHAGLFTSAADLARFARMLLNGGVAEDGRRLLSAQSMALMSTVQSPPALAERRGMGWDIDTPYSRPRGGLYPKTSFGHTGFTGCVLWIDPGSRSFYILLSNRVHPGQPSNLLPLYERLGTLAARAAGLDRGSSSP
ncbi:beta-lactamase family protein [Roseateles sp. DAIF2]|uniref:serine hydrolase domain-containing protein n=1 Tax=Roseateles sp. DAIF2 TaxID=2714952 RepID=UPI0018A2B49A|nr:serine hydrolase domain-containing protein [Roseateles sp. DAIF2]QPF71810.1 beta-lactamase family protein [Roseateles sp. DAIF2]